MHGAKRVKFADVTPIYPKDPQGKENYRPGSILSVLSKVFERLMQKLLIRLFMWLQTRFQNTTCLNLSRPVYFRKL